MKASVVITALAAAGCATAAPCARSSGIVVDVDHAVASDGTALRCDGAQVAWDASIARLAWSSPGLIRLRPDLARHHPGVQVFAFLHECGHLVAPMPEGAADCWAAGRAEELRAISEHGWSALRELMPADRWRGIMICRGAQ